MKHAVITEVKKECYACGTVESKQFYPNRDYETWLPWAWLCDKCMKRLVYWPKQFRDKTKRIRHREMCKRESGKRRGILIGLLGGKCVCNGQNCWHERSCGITDTDILQIEHINGGGNLQHKTMGPLSVYLYYIEHPEARQREIQLHCANCNWKKKARQKENKTRIIEEPEPSSQVVVAN